MEDIILQKILADKNVLIVGKTDSGKTYFIKNELIPFLVKNKLNVYYFENCDKLELNNSADIFIIDEVEIAADKLLLEKLHPEEKPYYTEEYLEKIRSWHNKLSKIVKSVICIVTRNDQMAIDNLVENYKSLESVSYTHLTLPTNREV